MLKPILPRIVGDADIRAAEATRIAYEVYFSAPREDRDAIARYGQFVDNQQAVLPIAMKDFYRATGRLPDYQTTVAPLQGYEVQLSDFEDKFALAVFRLTKK